MTVKETELQKEMHAMIQKAAELKEEFSGEKNRLWEELNLMLESKKQQSKFLYDDSLYSNNSCVLFPCLFL